MRMIAFAVLLVSASQAVAEDTAKDYWEAKRKESITTTEQKIKDTSHEIAQISSGKKQTLPGVSRAEAVKQARMALAELKLRMRDLKDTRKAFPLPIHPETWKVGDEGPIVMSYKVEFAQVIDKQNAICTLDGVDPSDYVWSRFWLKGYPTKGIVDGHQIDKLPGLWKVTDTKTYQTSNGSKTVRSRAK